MGRVAVIVAVVLLGFVLLLAFLPTQRSQLETALITPSDSRQVSDGQGLQLEPDMFTGSSLSDGRTYSVSLIDDNKNKIPTGTPLFVQGTLLSAQWTQDNACSWLLIRGRANVQHGDNPAAYCRFSFLLTEKNGNGEDLWPAASLVCDTTPEEMQEVTRLYRYGDTVQVHGYYAASLDFGVVPGMGNHFGVPLMEDCTFADPTGGVVQPERSAGQPVAPKPPQQTLARPPKLVSQVDAEYTAEARAAKFNGTVTVSLIVDTDGFPQDLRIKEPIGMGLDQAALTAVSRYQFEPARDETGSPVSAPVNVNVTFQIY